eukprot:NODE_4024_length_717_cov_293.324773.p1 GENE.NODE_4024_length_717_cov_293.324773~~NODE_4024_length_717_cov_293.324773.p1  ORF type:complete len:206 (+),score=15.95 NODE_4024_length_717_cov_293.324773:3-620(+)
MGGSDMGGASAAASCTPCHVDSLCSNGGTRRLSDAIHGADVEDDGTGPSQRNCGGTCAVAKLQRSADTNASELTPGPHAAVVLEGDIGTLVAGDGGKTISLHPQRGLGSRGGGMEAEKDSQQHRRILLAAAPPDSAPTPPNGPSPSCAQSAAQQAAPWEEQTSVPGDDMLSDCDSGCRALPGPAGAWRCCDDDGSGHGSPRGYPY